MGTSRRDPAMIQMKIARLLTGLVAAVALVMLLASSASALETRTIIHSVGKDGTQASNFNGGRVTFDENNNKLYTTYQSPNGIYGFDVSTPGTYTPLAAFSPKETSNPGYETGLSVDNAGNVFMSSNNTNRLYGLDPAGNFLAGFGGELGLDPATTPGAPDGSPKYICGSSADSAGNVWVSNYETGKILEYNS